MIFEYNLPTRDNIEANHRTLIEQIEHNPAGWNNATAGAGTLTQLVINRFGFRRVRVRKDDDDEGDHKFLGLVAAWVDTYGTFFNNMQSEQNAAITAAFHDTEKETRTVYAAPNGEPSGDVTGEEVVVRDGARLPELHYLTELANIRPIVGEALREFARAVLLEVLA